MCDDLVTVRLELLQAGGTAAVAINLHEQSSESSQNRTTEVRVEEFKSMSTAVQRASNPCAENAAEMFRIVESHERANKLAARESRT